MQALPPRARNGFMRRAGQTISEFPDLPLHCQAKPLFALETQMGKNDPLLPIAQGSHSGAARGRVLAWRLLDSPERPEMMSAILEGRNSSTRWLQLLASHMRGLWLLPLVGAVWSTP